MSIELIGDVICGFPSPGEENREDSLDFNTYLIKHRCSTFCLRAYGESMSPVIMNDDILVVDRSLGAINGDIVVAENCGDFTVKYLHKEDGKISLVPENPSFSTITATHTTRLFGVVTAIVRKTRQ